LLGFTNGGLNLGFIGKVKEKTHKFNFSNGRETVNERRRRKEELRRQQEEEKLKGNQNGSKNGHNEHFKRGIQEQAKYYDANAD
jgi:hypothetical protein